MKKFEIIERSAELKEADLKEACTLVDEYQKTVAEFDDIEQAKAAFNDYSSYIKSFSSPIGTLYSVTEFYLEENEYDEDGEWVDGGDIWAVTSFPSVDK